MARQERVIVLAMDNSAHADYAFEYYVHNIKSYNDRVIILNCIEMEYKSSMSQGIGDGDTSTGLDALEKRRAAACMKRLTENMKRANVHGRVRQVHGCPKTQIIRVAREENAKLIIMGTRGLSKLRRMFVGSVSDHVLHHAHLPVLVVNRERHKAAEKAGNRERHKSGEKASNRERHITV